MAEFINATDSLNEGRKKLNAIAKEMNEKDVASMPEIIQAREGKNSLYENISTKVGGVKKAELENLSSEVLSAIEGGEGTSFDLLSVPQDDSVTTKKLANSAVTTEKISADKLEPFVIQGIKKTNSVNLFNKNNVTKGGFYQGSNGAWVANSAWVSSDFIPVVAGITYTTDFGSNVTEWDTNKEFVGSLSGKTFTVPEGTAFIRVATPLTDLDKIMVTLSSEYPSQYVPFDQYTFGTTFDVFEGVEIDAQNIEGVKEVSSINLFDKHNIIPDGYYQSGTGDWYRNTAWNSSNFIRVEPGKHYQVSESPEIVFWDTDKNFVSGLRELSFKIPDNVNYVTCALHDSDLDTFMMTLKEDYPNNYIPHKTYVLDESWDVLKDKTVDPKQLKGVTRSRSVNLFNKDTVRTGGYYDGANNGVWRTFSGWCSSELIPVVEGILYKATRSVHFTCWDANGNFVYSHNHSLIPIPKGTTHIRIGSPLANINDLVVALEDEFPDYYVPYMVNEFNDDWDIPDRVAVSNKIKSTEDKLDEHEMIFSDNYTPPIRLELEDFSGYNQPYHPSAVYVEGGFNGYKYWLVVSPIPSVANPYHERFEVPVVHKSNDGINWEVVESANPLDDLTQAEIDNTDYMSDPHIVYREDTKTLEVWYRKTIRQTNIPTTTFRKTTTDGVTWTEREVMIPELSRDDREYTTRSPAIIWDNDRKVYKIWYYNSNINTTFYNEIPDNGIYVKENQQEITFSDGEQYNHIDVNYFNGEYHFLGYDVNPERVAHYTSDDGMNFVLDRDLLHSSDGDPLYENKLYRSVSLLNEYGQVMLYFSFQDKTPQRGVALIIADSFDDIQPTKRVRSNKVVLDDGMSLQELAKEVFRLRDIIESE